MSKFRDGNLLSLAPRRPSLPYAARLLEKHVRLPGSHKSLSNEAGFSLRAARTVTKMWQPGLSLSSFTPQDEREQLMAVFAATVYERGYALTRLTDVAGRAGVAPEA